MQGTCSVLPPMPGCFSVCMMVSQFTITYHKQRDCLAKLPSMLLQSEKDASPPLHSSIANTWLSVSILTSIRP
jgi:hypothetical protein